MIYVSERRLDELRSSLAKTTSDNSMRFRSLASIVDQIISMRTTVGNIVRLMIRHSYAAIENRSCWDQIVSISLGVREKLSFWFTKFLIGKPNPVQLGLFTRMPVTLVQCGRENVSGSWTVEQMAGSSTLSSLSVSLSCPQVNRLVGQVVYR